MHRSRNPSFSSSLLDEIYNSIDPTTHKTQSFTGSVHTTKKQSISVTRPVPDRKIQKDRFFSSMSSSSDSNSSIFSSSDTEPSSHAKKTSSSARPLCFGPSKTTKPRKTEDKKTLFHQNRAFRVSDICDYATDEKSENTRTRRSAKSSSSNQKKPKTPASPGVRIVNFINSLFSNSNSSSKHSSAVKSYPRKASYYDDYKPTDYNYPSTTCSSASSFSRSCMNRRSSEKSSDRTKRSVRFSPVNVIVPESRSYVEVEDYLSSGYIRKSVKKNVEDGGRRSVEEIAREFLRNYHKKHGNGLVKSNAFEDYEDDDHDDDLASDCSSDLFELDLVGTHHHNLYGDELPVYETTFAGLIL